MLKGKRVLLGVSAGIAAYKSPLIVRQLIKAGAEVQVILTPDASSFVTPLTLSTLSKRPVFHQYFDKDSGEWNNHVEFAKWADIFLIAPATANTIAKMAQGICDNLLLATYYSIPDPSKVYFAPAMDLDMFKHPQIQENIDKLKGFGNQLIDAEEGELASGLHGKGRMAEVEHIIAALDDGSKSKWKGKKVLVTAGPTYEEIDPVRFIGNYSSGKMGYAIAQALINVGADVILISGPTNLDAPSGTKLISVRSANEMMEAVTSNQRKMDAFIMSAAVSDYRPKSRADQKIKKDGSGMEIKLDQNPDILKTVGESKKKDQLLVGFALETENAEENAKKKLKNKNADFIILNSLEEKGTGFGHDTNKVSIIGKDNKAWQSEFKSKSDLAVDIIQYLEKSL
ncbi:MAG: bifunctional phosphopantothenoylcysteine decarboxylase/phosphopantothenate--cysteine ligase CoaBC [Flavobacteriales bacterium]|nr:bifunctional phosphopantothenoylcysteine decarboxylase/phosphopantothenate--cysteine ligase CoaBC [Flavobacteriales bacterium]